MATIQNSPRSSRHLVARMPSFSERPESAPTAPSHLDHLPQLDAMRGIACLVVLIAHLKAVRGLGWISDLVGTAGVGLFFALSGFLITRILIADKAAGRGLNAFYNRRVGRIFPIYYLTLAVLWFVWPGRELAWAGAFTFNLHFQTGFREYFHVAAGNVAIPPVAHFWSLCVEEHFYWVWPAIIWLLPARVYRWLPMLLVAAAPAVTYWCIEQLTGRLFSVDAIEGMIWRITPTQLVALGFGASIAIFERPLNRTVSLIGVKLPLVTILGAVALVGGIAGWVAVQNYVAAPMTRLIWEPTLLHLGCGGCVAMCLGWSRLGGFPGLRGVGKISYGLYLYHLPVYAWFGLADGSTRVTRTAGIAAFLATFAAAAISFRLFEAPILAWSRRTQFGLLVGRGHYRLSVGSMLTMALAGVFTWQFVQWTASHPWVPTEMRYSWISSEPSNAPSTTSDRQTPATAVALNKSEKEAPNVTGFMFMGIQHDLNPELFRRKGPIPPPTPGVPRVAVVGDSYTYGYCVEADRVIAAVAERVVKERGVPMEVLNLGNCGAQVEEVLGIVRKTALPHGADVVVYVATSDDFSSRAEKTQLSARKVLEDMDCANHFREKVRTMRDECAAKGVAFRVIPMTQFTNNTIYAALMRHIQKLCALDDVGCIDVDAYLSANRHRHFEFGVVDNHPSAECHRHYGEMIAGELLRLHESKQIESHKRQ